MKKVQLFLVMPHGPRPMIEGIFSNPEHAVHCAMEVISDAMKIERVFMREEQAKKLILNAAILEGTRNKIHYKVHPELMPDPSEVLRLAQEQRGQELQRQAEEKNPTQPFNRPRIVDETSN